MVVINIKNQNALSLWFIFDFWGTILYDHVIVHQQQQKKNGKICSAIQGLVSRRP